MRIVYFLEAVSSWCHWAEPSWAELKRRYEGRVDFQWRIALMPPEAFPVSRSQCDWFYRRSGTINRSTTMLNSGWFEAELAGDYSVPNLLAEAGRDLGINDDRLRLALTRAGLVQGLKVGRLEVAAAVAAEATGRSAAEISALALSPAVRARIDASTAEFHALGASQRPAFLLTNRIGDKALFSGLAQAAPLAATIDAMLADAEAYACHEAHFGRPPAD